MIQEISVPGDDWALAVGYKFFKVSPGNTSDLGMFRMINRSLGPHDRLGIERCLQFPCQLEEMLIQVLRETHQSRWLDLDALYAHFFF